MILLRNPVLGVTVGVLLAAIAASFITLGLALDAPESELPEEYHWEGFRLDRDFDRSRHASALAVRATLDVTGGMCRVRLAMHGPHPPALRLTLTHATLPRLDRSVALQPVGNAYEAPCDVAPGKAAWRVALEDSARTWSVRERAPDPLHDVTLAAAPAEAVRR